MSVLSCNRNGCDNIMCENYSFKYGYLCDECKEDLLQKGPCGIKEFMDTRKQCLQPAFAWEQFINEEFKSRKE